MQVWAVKDDSGLQFTPLRVTEACRIALLTWAVSQFQKVSRDITVSAVYFIIINFALVGSETGFSVLGPVAPAILKSSFN